jgi:hypothetical protein
MKESLQYNLQFNYEIDFKKVDRIDWKPQTTSDHLSRDALKKSVEYWGFMNIKIDADSKNSWTSTDKEVSPPPHLSSVLTIFSNREDLVEEETKLEKTQHMDEYTHLML